MYQQHSISLILKVQILSNPVVYTIENLKTVKSDNKQGLKCFLSGDISYILWESRLCLFSALFKSFLYRACYYWDICHILCCRLMFSSLAKLFFMKISSSIWDTVDKRKHGHAECNLFRFALHFMVLRSLIDIKLAPEIFGIFHLYSSFLPNSQQTKGKC